jgi:hypothetical protein
MTIMRCAGVLSIVIGAGIAVCAQSVPMQAPRVDPIPTIQTVPQIQTIPQIKPAPGIEPLTTAPVPVLSQPVTPVQQPQTAVQPQVQVTPPPPEPHREAPDCSVHRLSCAKECEPLPQRWPSYRECVRTSCKMEDENCLEALANALERRHEANESSVTFKIKSDSEYAVLVGFYSQDRNVSWSRNGDGYNIDDYGTHTYRLRCSAGEKICYGAWTSAESRYWGVGRSDRYGCKNCCRTCNASEATYTLK